MEIYVVRHTRVNVAPNLCYGQTDVPLADSFAAEAAEVCKKLPPLNGNVIIYSSPLSRCRKLAEQLHQGPIQFDPRLMEFHFGNWELKRWDEIPAIHLKTWAEDFVNLCCPGGESFQELFTRATAFWEDLRRQTVDLALVVTHGGLIRALFAHLLQIPLEHSMRIDVDYGGVSKIQLNEYGTLIKYINR
jgi:alpha-ribazole phosphatase